MKKKLREAMARSVQGILSKSPVIIYTSDRGENGTSDDEDPTCAICLETFKSGEKLRKLGKNAQRPGLTWIHLVDLVCSHSFHLACIDPWLLTRQLCPLCNRNILRNSVPSISSGLMLDASERHPTQTNLSVESSAPIENSNL
jgi:hypothetical protein